METVKTWEQWKNCKTMGDHVNYGNYGKEV